MEGGVADGRRFSLDRSKLRVLLCDKDPKSSQELLRLLNNCSYQVMSVRTDRQVIDMLTNGNEIDIVLSEVDLPIAKGLKMLKCIASKKEWRLIPIIMMSSQDEVSVVGKCLRLGAADFLLKPLRTNELLNLWTHTWRRRHMFGQAQKDIFNQNIELILSDLSDTNTNSTTSALEDANDKSRTSHQEVTLLDQREHEFDKPALEPIQNILSVDDDNSLRDVKHAVCSKQMFLWPRKADLKVGHSSAFLNYVKSRTPRSNSHFSHVDQDASPSELLNGEEKNLYVGGNVEGRNCWDVQESNSLENPIPSNENVSNRCMLKAPEEFPIVCSSSNHLLSRTEGQVDVPGMQPKFHVPIYLHGQPESMQGFQGTLYDPHLQNPASLLQYNVLPQAHHTPLMRDLAYYPVGTRLPLGNTPPSHQWSSSTRSHVPQLKTCHTEMRAAALMKFKQKKKDRCYDKKIRYINRKLFAEKRPRVQGQFVRQVTGVDIQLNDSPPMIDYDSDEEEDEPLSREL